MKIILKKGAMFGLDARIALAIFGALSIISGAALYSAIKNAKTISAHQQLTEIVKASEGYYLDTGIPLGNMNGHIHDLNTNALIENEQSQNNWAGPYIPATKVDSISSKIKLNGLDITIYMYRNAGDDWSVINNNPPIRCSVATKGCYEWVMTYTSTVEQATMISKLFTDLDNKYDNGDGSAKGDIRYRSYSAANKRILMKGLLRGQKDEL